MIPRYTDAEDAELLRLRHDEGLSYENIARRLSRGVSWQSVRRRYELLTHRDHERPVDPRKLPAMRGCLGGCGKPFKSAHAGNRVCKSCAAENGPGSEVTEYESRVRPGKTTLDSYEAPKVVAGQ